MTQVHTASIRIRDIHLELATELCFVGCTNELLQSNSLICTF